MAKITTEDKTTLPKAKDKKSERPRPKFWGSAFAYAAMVIVLFGIVYSYYMKNINAYVVEHAPADYQLNTYEQLWITACSAVVIFILRYLFTVFTRSLFLKVVPTSEDNGEIRTEDELDRRAEKVEAHMFDMMFYMVSAYCGWVICKDTEWMPSYLGGNGHLSLSLSNLPFAKYEPILPTYAFITFGFRIEGFISNFLKKEKANDYMEMFFHDIVTILLFLGYLYGNMMPIGTLVVIIHDVTDVPCHISKGLYATIYRDQATVPFLFSQLLWAYLRLYCFARIIHQLLQTEYPEGRKQFTPFIYLSAGFLCALYALHWLWFAMFQRLNLAVLRKTKNVESEIGHIGGDSPIRSEDSKPKTE